MWMGVLRHLGLSVCCTLKQHGQYHILHKNCCIWLHQQHLSRPSHTVYWLIVVFSMALALTNGLTMQWSPHEPSSQVRVRWRKHHRPTMADSQQSLHRYRCHLNNHLLSTYHRSLLPSSCAWESFPHQQFPTSQCLQVEAQLLGKAFDRLWATLPPHDYHKMLPHFHFAGTDFATPPPMLPTGILDLHALFGPMAPDGPLNHSTYCLPPATP